MKRFVMTAAVLIVTGVLLTGCGQPTHGSGSVVPSKPVMPAAMSFSRLHAGALDTVDFISDTVGYVGGQGLILKSTDGGRTWMKLYVCPENIVSIVAVDSNNVWAATKDHLLHSTDGLHFKRVSLPEFHKHSNSRGIQTIDFVNKDQGFILADGTIWRLSTERTGLQKATPPEMVNSLTFTAPQTGFAAGGNRLYKTVDGGRAWDRIFTAPVRTGNAEIPWRASVRAASADNVWLLVSGGGAGMSQLAYVVFHTTNGGSFTPVMEEGYFASLYPTIHLVGTQNLGAQPGPFTVCGNRTAIFLGWYPDQFQLTRTMDNGKTFVRYQIGSSDNKKMPNFFSPLAISFIDATHGWLVGGREKRGIILYTTDGENFTAVP